MFSMCYAGNFIHLMNVKSTKHFVIDTKYHMQDLNALQMFRILLAFIGIILSNAMWITLKIVWILVASLLPVGWFFFGLAFKLII